MASLRTEHLDERGVVYVEFLMSFFPVFLIFLSVCQLSLLTSASIVVGQAANQGARSAIVIVEDAPEHFDDAPRGSLSAGKANPEEAIESLLTALGNDDATDAPSPPEGPQHGARMTPIRTAAYAPLLALSPHDRAWVEGGSLRDGVRSGFIENLGFALRYTRAATSISVHDYPESDWLAQEPLHQDANLTLRVTYLFQCSIPIIRSILCSPLEHWIPATDEDEDEDEDDQTDLLAQSEAPGELTRIASESSRFMLIVKEVTLPIQGAKYYGRAD